MILEKVREALNLQKDEPRNFLVSVSGGSDSIVLLHILFELTKIYSPIKLRVFHVNFQLRKNDSLKDEEFVKAYAKKLGIPFSKRRVKRKKEDPGVQEWARKQRVLSSASLFPDFELVEAHHLDDQIETFFLRLIRGVGLSGLSCMSSKTLRYSRVVQRPLLKVSKSEILAYAKKNKLRYREDKSNQKTIYDRNWLRLEVLPLIHQKSSHFRHKIEKLIEEIQESEIEKKKLYKEGCKQALKAADEWNWQVLRTWSGIQRKSFIHSFFQDDWGIFLNRDQILELNQKLSKSENFSFNAPKGIVIKGFMPSRRYPEGKLKIQNLSN